MNLPLHFWDLGDVKVACTVRASDCQDTIDQMIFALWCKDTRVWPQLVEEPWFRDLSPQAIRGGYRHAGAHFMHLQPFMVEDDNGTERLVPVTLAQCSQLQLICMKNAAERASIGPGHLLSFKAHCVAMAIRRGQWARAWMLADAVINLAESLPFLGWGAEHAERMAEIKRACQALDPMTTLSK